MHGLRQIVVVLTLVISANAFAATLRGLVTSDGGGRALGFVDVVLSEAGDGAERRSASTSTDVSGRYVFDDVPDGAWTLTFSMPGFAPATEALTIVGRDTVVVDVVLSPAAVELEDLVVTSRASDAEAGLQTGYLNLDQMTLKSIPSVIEPDPLRALQALPGVQSASDISSGLYIRGGGPDQNLIAANGVTVYNPTHAFGFFSTFNSDVVDDVALYKGAYPAAYGGRLGAVLDVGLRKDTSPELSGKLGVSLIAVRGLLEGRLGPDQWYVAGRRSWLDPLLDALRSDENPIPDYFFYDANVGFTSDRGGGRTVLSWYHGLDDLGVDAETFIDFDLNWGNDVLLLSHARELSETTDMTVALSRSRYESLTDATVFSTDFDVTNTLQDVTLKGALNRDLGDRHRLTFGLSASWYEFVYRQSFSLESQVDYDAAPFELAGYLEDRWFLGETIIRSGLRVRHIGDGDRWLAEPRLSISRPLNPELRWKLGGGLYNQYLQLVSTEGFSAGDFYLPIDETADPGRSWQAVTGLEWTPSGRDLVTAEVYTTGLSDLLEFDNRAPVDQTGFTAENLFVTGGEGWARGLEVFYRRQQGRFTGWLGYTLGWTERRFDELNGGDAFVPKYDRRHDVNAILSWQAGAWKLSSAFRFATGQAFTPASARYQVRDPGTGVINDFGQILPGDRNSGRLAPYHRLDVSARRPVSLFGAPAELSLSVFNIYSRRNEWFVQYDTDGEVTEVSVTKMLPLIPSVGVNFEF